MRTYNVLVFDDLIVGSSSTWYSSDAFNGLLGAADAYAVQACFSNVAGSSPKITVQAETSADNQNWFPHGATSEISAADMANDTSVYGYAIGVPPLMGNLRFKITLSATSGTPQCRLKLYVTGRVRGARGAAPMPTS